MSLPLELAVLVIQGATLVGVVALLVTRWGATRPTTRRIEHVDHDPSEPTLDLGRYGTLTIGGVHDGQVRGLTLDGPLEGLTVYEVWALTRAGWVQLVPDREARYDSPLLQGERVTSLRLWVDKSTGRPDTRPAQRAAPMLVAAALTLAPRPAEPIAAGAPPVVRWAAERERDVLVTGLLDEWTEACLSASRVGWVLGIPTGDALLSGWARSVSSVDGPPAAAFARWFVGQLGKATRQGIDDRAAADRREPVARLVFTAAARLLRALDEDLELDPAPPRAVGPRQRERWLVDEALAVRLDNAPVNGLVQPVFVLRPVLRRGDTVLIEGEVA